MGNLRLTNDTVLFCFGCISSPPETPRHYSCPNRVLHLFHDHAFFMIANTLIKIFLRLLLTYSRRARSTLLDTQEHWHVRALLGLVARPGTNSANNRFRGVQSYNLTTANSFSRPESIEQSITFNYIKIIHYGRHRYRRIDTLFTQVRTETSPPFPFFFFTLYPFKIV